MQQYQQAMQYQQPVQAQEPVLYQGRTCTITPTMIRVQRPNGLVMSMPRNQLAGVRMQVTSPAWLMGGAARITFIDGSGRRIRIHGLKVASAQHVMRVLGYA